MGSANAGPNFACALSLCGLAPVTLDKTRKRLLFRSQHRGTKEADILVGRFAEAHIASLSPEEVAQFESLLQLSDVDLYNWKTGRAELPAEHDTPLMRKFLSFDPSTVTKR